MSGEQITNNSVETQNLEGELHSLKNSSKKKRVDINVLLNKVRLAQRKENIESTIFFSLFIRFHDFKSLSMNFNNKSFPIEFFAFI